MKKLITAIGTNELNEKLREKEIYEIIGNDIPYQDGVIEVLRRNPEIDILILSETLSGEKDIKDFLNKIKEISPYTEIIFFMRSMNDEFKLFLQRIGIDRIYTDRSYSIEEIVNDICQTNNEKNLNLEIERLKRMIEEKDTEKKHKKKNIKRNKEESLKLPKAISIAGSYGSGKSTITSMLARTCEKLKLRVIIIDFDIFNKSITNMFDTFKKENKYKIIDNLEQCIKKVSNNISVFYGIDILFNENNKIDFNKMKKIIDKLSENYDVIFIDTSSEISLKYVKTAFANSERIFFLIEPNLIEIRKAQDLLEIYVEDWEVPVNKINIVLNKANVNSIDDEIITKLFGKFKIIGKINFSKLYTIWANNVKLNVIKLNNYERILRKIR